MNKTCLEKMNLVYNKLQDDESRKIWEARLSYAFDRDHYKLEDELHRLYNDWKCEELEEYIATLKPKGIIIFGCGNDGKQLKKNLSYWGYNVDYFCDNDIKKIGTTWEGVKILSVQEVLNKFTNYLVIIGSIKFRTEMYENLKQLGFPQKNILLPKNLILLGRRANQYFDVFKPTESEVFLNCGGYDGQIIFNFIDWANGKYKYIYSFEPIEKMNEVIKERCRKESVKNIDLLQKAVWNNNEILKFQEMSAGSRVDDGGEVSVEGVTIDSIIGNQDATFIKMDVEGSELNALQGAQNVIKNKKPKLAICIYHKPEDIYEIGAYILSLVPEYKFKIRH